MKKTITVVGSASVSAQPDLININFTVTSRNKSYDTAVTLASDQTERLRKALAEAGHKSKALKLQSFDVHPNYDYTQDDDGSTKSVFVDYECSCSLRLTFPLDYKLLSETVDEILKANVSAEFYIGFSLKHKGRFRKKLFKRMTKNAKKKAKRLCALSGAELGELISVDYGTGMLPVMCDTNIMPRLECKGAFSMPDVAPEDITLNDSATFVWRID